MFFFFFVLCGLFLIFTLLWFLDCFILASYLWHIYSAIFVVIAGASSGIGTDTARVLALRGVHVVMAVRNLSAGRDVKEAIVKEIPSCKVDVMELDLSSLASVRKFASEFISLDLPLNILMWVNWRTWTIMIASLQLFFLDPYWLHSWTWFSCWSDSLLLCV